MAMRRMLAGLVILAALLFLAFEGLSHAWTFSGPVAVAEGRVVKVRVEHCGYLLDSCGRHKFYRAHHTIRYRGVDGVPRTHVYTRSMRRRESLFAKGERVPIHYRTDDPTLAFVGEVDGQRYEGARVEAGLMALVVIMVGALAFYVYAWGVPGRPRRRGGAS